MTICSSYYSAARFSLKYGRHERKAHVSRPEDIMVIEVGRPNHRQ